MALDKWAVSTWMSTHLCTVSPKAPLVDAFELMQTHRFRHVPVVEKKRLVGMVSDRDVRQALPKRGKANGEAPAYAKAMMHTPVEKIMSRKLFTVTPETPIREAAELICREKIGALPVTDGAKLLGIVSAEDLLWAFLENLREVAFEEE